jgi:hypothetical protein
VPPKTKQKQKPQTNKTKANDFSNKKQKKLQKKCLYIWTHKICVQIILVKTANNRIFSTSACNEMFLVLMKKHI